MSEVVIKYKDDKALQAIRKLAKRFNIEITELTKKEDKPDILLPINFAKQPNANALSGIWKKEPRTIKEIREKAWGKRT